MALTLLTYLILGGVVALIGMQAATLFSTRRTHQSLIDLTNGTVNAVGHFNERLEGIEQIPQILQELNLGGVQLMPQKTIGETILEGIMGHFWGNNAEKEEIKSLESQESDISDATTNENSPKA